METPTELKKKKKKGGWGGMAFVGLTQVKLEMNASVTPCLLGICCNNFIK